MAPGNDKLSGKKMLVVEDEYILAEDVCDVLRDCGAEIVGPAGNLEEGIALAQNAMLSTARSRPQ